MTNVNTYVEYLLLRWTHRPGLLESTTSSSSSEKSPGGRAVSCSITGTLPEILPTGRAGKGSVDLYSTMVHKTIIISGQSPSLATMF